MSGLALESLKSLLRDRHLLLAIGNFEQVLAAAFEIGELLAACPRLHVMVAAQRRATPVGRARAPGAAPVAARRSSRCG